MINTEGGTDSHGGLTALPVQNAAAVTAVYKMKEHYMLEFSAGMK